MQSGAELFVLLPLRLGAGGSQLVYSRTLL